MGDPDFLNGLGGEVLLLKRHLEMLDAIQMHQPAGIIRLSELLGMPRHKVRYSLRMLEKEGYIVATADGAVVSDKYSKSKDALHRQLEDIIFRLETIKKEHFE